MTSSFQRLMGQAQRLTQSGDLRGATAAIQAALTGRAATAAANDGRADDGNAIDRGVMAANVIDAHMIDADVIDADGLDGPVIDVEARESGASGQFITGTHTASAGSRDYKLYVPPAHRARRLPLVVMLHGCTQNPDDFAAGTGMNEAALERGFLVLYPAQSQQANPNRCWNWFKHNHQRRGRGEPALLAGMTREVMRRYGVDPARVYVAGLSAGGAMAAILGEAYPDLYAAVGVHSGLATGAASDLPSALAAMNGGAAGSTGSGRTPPTIVFHGDHDTTVHPANGEHVVAASAGAAASELERARSGNGREYTRRAYRDASGRVIAEHWAVHGSGHAWSGGRARGSYTDARGPDATREMLRFFFSHALPSAG